jgi:hypothetical protein
MTMVMLIATPLTSHWALAHCGAGGPRSLQLWGQGRRLEAWGLGSSVSSLKWGKCWDAVGIADVSPISARPGAARRAPKRSTIATMSVVPVFRLSKE